MPPGVALRSWRPAEWRVHDPHEVFTNGLQERCELVAWGGPDNGWILEVGDAERWGSFGRFCDEVVATDVEVTDHGWGDDGGHVGFDVSYRSPAEGVLRLDREGRLEVDGRHVATSGYPRFDNPFTSVAEGGSVVRLADDSGTFLLDLAAGTRQVEPAR